MTASQPDEEALFNAARQIGDGAARAQYLREATGGDEGLLRRVEARLAVHDAPDRLLDRPAAAGGVTGACGIATGVEMASVLPREGAGLARACRVSGARPGGSRRDGPYDP